MAPLKPFLQVFPGQNDPNLRPRKGKDVDPKEWERKQRLKEYRIASRREKRNRKSDEKKQRKLNATILRRMTRNPAKYTKNAARNRGRAIEMERRKIQASAISMMHRIAAVYDPTGKMFNIKPVITLEDGRVVTVESMERRKERAEQKEREEAEKQTQDKMKEEEPAKFAGDAIADRLNPERMRLLIDEKMNGNRHIPGQKSKTQMRKDAKFAPRDPPPKPFLPEGIDIPSDEEENWMELWDLPDTEIERRLIREKRRKARGRKELRIKQKEGKAERRAARDEKRRLYREIKESWKILREEERRRRKFLITLEDEEGKRLALQVTRVHREFAMAVCQELGFTMENVEGVDDIKPRALGMKGVEVDFDDLEEVGDKPGGLRFKGQDEPEEKPLLHRPDLSSIAQEKYLEEVFGGADDEEVDNGDQVEDEFLKVGVTGQSHHYEALNLNHKTRRKLRRALENTQVSKELLVRETAIKHCEEKGIPVHPVLRTSAKPINIRGSRTLRDGSLETAKQERVCSSVELTEFNKQAKVLRRQAKEMAIEAGIRIYLELMDVIPKREGLEEMVEARAREKLKNSGIGPPLKDDNDDVNAMDVDDDGEAIGGIWPAQSTANLTASQWLEDWPIPEDPMARYEGNTKWGEDGVREDISFPKANLSYNDQLDGNGDVEMEDTSESSAAKQLKREHKAQIGKSKIRRGADLLGDNSPSDSSGTEDNDNEEVDEEDEDEDEEIDEED